MYFSKIPVILYPYKIGGQNTLKPVRDITHNVRFRKEVFENITLYDEYDLKDGETPEILADRIYGSSEYHWVIMLFNQRYNYIEDFPMTDSVLNQCIAAKYEDPYATRHYENEDGLIVNSDVIGAVPVTHYDWEVRQNEAKRRIRLISPELLGVILGEYNII